MPQRHVTRGLLVAFRNGTDTVGVAHKYIEKRADLHPSAVFLGLTGDTVRLAPLSDARFSYWLIPTPALVERFHGFSCRLPSSNPVKTDIFFSKPTFSPIFFMISFATTGAATMSRIMTLLPLVHS